MSDAITPALVVGTARSGTTWLTNFLASHPQIVTPQHEAHWGAIECRMFLLDRFAGDLSDDRRFIRFVELFGSSDLFRLLHGDKDTLYRNRRQSACEMVLDLLDDFARARGTTHWVTKLDPELLYYPHARERFFSLLKRRYPAVCLVGIRRAADAVLRSYLKMEGASSIHRLGPLKRRAALVLECARYAAHTQAVEELVAEHEGLMLSFDDLKGEYALLAKRLERALGIPFPPQPPAQRYRANTSHSKTRAADNPLPLERRVASALLIPGFEAARPIAVGILKLRDATRRKRDPFDWRLLRLDHMKASLRDELWRTGQTNLLEALFGSASS